MSVPGELGLTLEDTAAGVRRGELRPVDLTRASLDALDTLGRDLRAVARLEREDALAAAEAVRAGEGGPLAGVPLAHKDLFQRRGWRTEAGSRLMDGFVAEGTAFACRQLDAAGAIDLGRLNTVEFGLGTTGHNPVRETARNPWSPAHITGGSSSGPAAAVAAGLVPATLGSDTGGSVRLPAAACGLVGIKPTAGRIGRSGVVALSYSLDTVGPLTRTARDCALMMQALSGHDPADSGSARAPAQDFLSGIEDGLGGVRIGVAGNYFFDPVTPAVGDVLEEARLTLQRLGATMSTQEIEGIEQANRLTTLITAVEGAAAHLPWLRERAGEYGPQTLGRLATGLFVPAQAYARAQAYRPRLVRSLLDGLFRDVDLLFTPVWPFELPTIEESDLRGNPGFTETIVLSGHCTRPINFLGLPAITVPCGWTSGTLPVGFQLVARPFEEALLLRAARAFEREAGFLEQTPSMSVWKSSGRMAGR